MIWKHRWVHKRISQRATKRRVGHLEHRLLVQVVRFQKKKIKTWDSGILTKMFRKSISKNQIWLMKKCILHPTVRKRLIKETQKFMKPSSKWKLQRWRAKSAERRMKKWKTLRNSSSWRRRNKNHISIWKIFRKKSSLIYWQPRTKTKDFMDGFISILSLMKVIQTLTATSLYRKKGGEEAPSR